MNATILPDHDALDPTQRTSGGHRVRVLLRVTGEPPDRDEGTLLSLSLVLDRSGSMAGEKLEAMRDVAVTLLCRLRFRVVLQSTWTCPYPDRPPSPEVPLSWMLRRGSPGQASNRQSFRRW